MTGRATRHGGLDWRPIFGRSVRLRHDAVRQRWVLLAPERVIEPNATGLAILELVDGRAVREIVHALVARFGAPRGEIEADVLTLLAELHDHGVLDSAHPPGEAP